MKKKICIIFSLFLACLLSFQVVKASDVDLKDMNITATIKEDGSVHIKEVWDIDVYEGTEIYKVFDNMGDSKLSHLKVVDEKGLQYKNIGEWDSDIDKEEKNGKCGLITKDDGYELCFGIGEYGDRKYTFEYDISNFIQQYEETQGFNYAFFSEMSLEPRHVKITLTSPYKFDKDNSQIWAFGYYGQVLFDDGNVVMETSQMVEEGAKMQLLMRIDNGTFSKAHQNDQRFEDILNDAIEGSDYDSQEYDQGEYYNSFAYKDNGDAFLFAMIGVIGAIALCGGLVAIIVNIGRVKYQFNDQIPMKEKKEINMFRDIPCHKDIFEFYYLAKKLELLGVDDRSGLIAAILLRWIQNGYIEFKKEEVKQFLFFKSEGYSIDLDKVIPVGNDLEKELLGFFKNAAGSNRILETKEFENWCSKHYEDIDDWFDKVDEYIENNYRKNGLLSLETTYTHFIGIKIPHDTDTYDASIREEMEHIIGLKKFLEEMSLIDEKEVIEVKLWEEYLIFASILGIADKVQEQLGRLCPTFNEQSQLDTVYTMHMVHMFSHNSMTASMQASRSSGMGGSSSFGGGGGGFSGGGGGGVR